jgi:hypothetical protein
MSMRPKLTTDVNPEVDTRREWSVYRCAHGCFHIALDRVTLTLTDDEFHALQDLMRRACAHFHQHAVTGDAGGRAH